MHWRLQLLLLNRTSKSLRYLADIQTNTDDHNTYPTSSADVITQHFINVCVHAAQQHPSRMTTFKFINEIVQGQHCRQLTMNILPRDAMRKRGKLLPPGVRLSVTFVYCIQMDEDRLSSNFFLGPSFLAPCAGTEFPGNRFSDGA